MSRNLLDTNAVLFALLDDPRLSAAARSAIASGSNFISVASYWEVAIKSMKGKLNVGDPRVWWTRALRELNARPLPIEPDYIEGLMNLPPIHQDPFDRILIASAIFEFLTLVSSNREVQQYASTYLRVIT